MTRFSMQRRTLLILLAVALGPSGPLAAQVGAGALFQSLDNLQLAGAGTPTLPGDPAVTKTEIVAWSAGDAPAGARVILNFEGLSTMFGDENGDGLPLDLNDIDALEVGTYAQGSSPSYDDFRFSLENPVLNAGGIPVITPGDIIRITGIGSWIKVIPEGAFQAALGSFQALNVDAYCELADGSVLVSFSGIGSGTNIVHPNFGTIGSYTWSGADIFIIRQPFGLLPALLAYRQSELQNIVGFYYPGYLLNEIVGVEQQPFTISGSNPWDPTNVYQGGTRPQILWTVFGDENVFAGVASANPISTSHNFFAIVSGPTGAGYGTNFSTNRVFADALALGAFPLPADSRITLDADSLFVTSGGTLTLSVRSPRPAGTQFQIVVAPNLGFGQGLVLPGLGFESMVLRITEPLLYLSLVPPLSTVLTTAGAAIDGSASTIPLPVSNAFTTQNMYFQAFELPTGTLSTPLMVRFN